jgi:DNA-directed RNA polymerase subunit RPC12/RpoP
MAKNPATCPGISQFMNPKPSYLKCPTCHTDVEIWSDEEQTTCQNCGTTVSRGKLQSCLDYCEFADKCKDLIETKKKERGEI